MSVCQFALAAVALALGATLAAAEEGQAREAPPMPCPQRCATAYPLQERLEESKSCDTGCTLLSIIETIDAPQGSTNLDGALDNCRKSCDKSFPDAAKSEACKDGCSGQVPVSLYRRKNMPSVPEPVGIMSGFPRIRIGFALPFGRRVDDDGDEGDGDGFGGGLMRMPDMSGVFGAMQRHMDDMMRRMRGMMGGGGGMDDMMEDMMQQARRMENGEAPEGGVGRGRLTIIKAGPGYHEEKTYNFGPDGVRKEVKTVGGEEPEEEERRSDDDVKAIEQEKPMGPDMMDILNPLERFFNKNEVEVLDNGDDLKPKDRENSFAIPGFDIKLDGPRLPEEGLRSRPRMEVIDDGELGNGVGRRVYVDKQAICARDSHNMKWSDWVSCLHLRMGLPRWLTAATVSLGVVFIIWLCLVIPHNAPKQRLAKKTKAQEAAGRLEEAYMTAPAGLVAAKLDLPPAYDVACLHVAVPAAEEQEEQAPPLPSKEPLGDDEKTEPKI